MHTTLRGVLVASLLAGLALGCDDGELTDLQSADPALYLMHEVDTLAGAARWDRYERDSEFYFALVPGEDLAFLGGAEFERAGAGWRGTLKGCTSLTLEVPEGDTRALDGSDAELRLTQASTCKGRLIYRHFVGTRVDLSGARVPQPAWGTTLPVEHPDLVIPTSVASRGCAVVASTLTGELRTPRAGELVSSAMADWGVMTIEPDPALDGVFHIGTITSRQRVDLASGTAPTTRPDELGVMRMTSRPDGRWLVASQQEDAVSLVDAAGKTLATLAIADQVPGPDVAGLTSIDDQLVAVVTRDGRILLVGATGETLTLRSQTTYDALAGSGLVGPLAESAGVAFDPRRGRLIVADQSAVGGLVFFALSTVGTPQLREVGRYRPGTGCVDAVVEGGRVIAGCLGSGVRVLDAASLSELASWSPSPPSSREELVQWSEFYDGDELGVQELTVAGSSIWAIDYPHGLVEVVDALPDAAACPE